MNAVLLYLLLLKASCTAFNGMAAIPIVRHDLVEHRHVLTDRQLNAAVAAARTAPGPNGLWMVSAGYFVAGVPGACAGWLAAVTPAFLIVVMLRYLGARADRPAVKSAIQCVTLAAAGLVVDAAIPLARDAITGWATLAIAAGAALVLLSTRAAPVWVILAAALAGWLLA
ncbi:MAG TPA: chromate transporter [Bryobacteraceae bacterium]|nr:chromate transporter [Bryobacteraceae bacterium]